MQLPFELDRPLIFFDLETTGLDVKKDRIVELALIKITPQGDVLEKERRYNPEMPIPAESTAVHGITDEDVANELPFCRTARNLHDQLIAGSDLSGFNIKGFDIHVLIAEFKRCGISFSVEGRRLLDMQNIFHKEEPRDLSAAARFYLGREHEEAHTALGDIRTSAAVLGAQLERYPDIPQDLDGLHDYCQTFRPFRTEVDRWFSSPEDGRVFRRGKHKGQPLATIAATAPDYLKWMTSLDDMDDDVIKVVKSALDSAALPKPATNDPEPGSDTP